MQMRRFIIFISLICAVNSGVAQSFVENDIEDILVGMDASLFRRYTPEVDPYGEATTYYRPVVSRYRRGLEWWLADEFVLPLSSVVSELDDVESERRVRLSGSTQDYIVGLYGRYSTMFDSGWSLNLGVDFRTGSDLNIEGVFREDIRGDLEVAKRLSNGGYISMSLDLPLLKRGLQSDATQEAITLTGDNLYNPTWGYYDGEVRNSRVSTYQIPSLDLRWQQHLFGKTDLVLNLSAEAGRRAISRLGWYDAANPNPDYYKNMPSYLSQGDTYEEISEIWRSQDPTYTQISWDRLISTNHLSQDGSAYYVLEDQVERRANVDAKILFSSSVGGGVDLIYGVSGEYRDSRRFKEVIDLLGADFLYDHDLFIGDYDNQGNDMQNNLRDPDREVGVGDRFGYDYTILGRGYALILGAEYHQDALSMRLRGEFGEYMQWRTGHYEKERFAGSASYGDSEMISMSQNAIDFSAGYSLSGRHHISMRGVWRTTPIDGTDLFIQPQNANRVIDNPTPRKMGSVEIGYRYEGTKFSLDMSGYLLSSRDETQVWSCYDDLSYTYSDVVVQGLSMRSLGIDLVGDYRVSSRFNWRFAVAVGDYTYDRTPTVTLYDDSDMTLLAETQSSALEGCKVGNAPQIQLSSSITFFADHGLIFTLNSSYSGGNYIAPSIVRRTDRVLAQAGSVEQRSEIITQEKQPDIFDLTASVVKTIFLRGDQRVSFNLRVNNLLGASDCVVYARESNRMLRSSGGSSTGVRYLEPNSYIYGVPRSFYLSCSYSF